jgi:putative PIN family toxin of toxin-antitoxin system
VKIILDTNVFVSGVFFTGPPYRILEAWRDGRLQLAVSREILEEYQRVGETLAGQFPGVMLQPILDLLATNAEIFPDQVLQEPICEDPDDDKFIACAVASRCKVIVSGDRHLLKVSGFGGIKVMRPRQFVFEYLSTHGLGGK